MRKTLRGQRRTLILLVWALAAGAALLWYWRTLGPQYLDSDMSSEQILAYRLAQSGGFPLLDKEWYYSTELHVFNTQFLMAWLFRLFPGWQWYTVRVVGSALLVLLYLGSYVCLARQARLPRWGLYGCILLMLPVGELYRHFVLSGLQYLPFIAYAFLAVGGMLAVVRGGGRGWPLLVCAVSFVAALGGPRLLATLNLPLTLAVLLLVWADRPAAAPRASLAQAAHTLLRTRWTAALCTALAADLTGLAGCLINTEIFAKEYVFFSQGYLAFATVIPQRLQWLGEALLRSFGWVEGSVFSFASVMNLFVLAVILFSFRFAWQLLRGARYPAAHRLLGAFYLSLAAALFFLYAFTNSGHSDRYLLPLAVLAVPLWECWMADRPARLPRYAAQGRALLAAGVLGFYTLCGGLALGEVARQPGDALDTAQYLVAQGYANGYATFWDGNILTELSNGQLEVWSLSPYNSWQIMQWLQDRGHETEAPEGPVFLVLSKWESAGERTASPAAMREAVPEEALVYENGSHLVYAFASDAELRAQCGLPAFGG